MDGLTVPGSYSITKALSDTGLGYSLCRRIDDIPNLLTKKASEC